MSTVARHRNEPDPLGTSTTTDQPATQLSHEPPDAQTDDVFVLPASFAQERLWFLDRLEPESPAYNVPLALALRQDLDVVVLGRCINEIIARHEILRTSFVMLSGRPAQVISPRLELQMPVSDLRHLDPAEQSKACDRLTAEEARRPFDLATGPLVRGRFVRLGDRLVLLLTLHHIVCDAWSMGIFFHELWTLYDCLSNNEPSPLPDLKIQYADFAHWQREWLRGEVLEQHLAFWRSFLDGAPPVIDLPTDRPRPAAQTLSGALQPFEVPGSVSESMRSLAKKHRCTLFMAFLAATTALLTRYTGQDDLVIGTPIANRNRVELEGLIGFFTNTLALRADLQGDPSFGQLLERTRAMTLQAFAHEDLPFEKLVEELQPERNLSHNPLVQVLFSFQTAPGPPGPDGPDADQAPPAPDAGAATAPRQASNQATGTSKFDMSFHFVDTRERISGAIEYNTDLFDSSTINRIIINLQSLLHELVSRPDAPISTLDLIEEGEQELVRTSWNQTDDEDLLEVDTLDLFAQQVGSTPGSVAITSHGSELTYTHLDELSSQLAGRLCQAGVAAEDRVCCLVERSAEAVIALLGVMKIGAVYVPLDPEYPSERLEHMLSASSAAALVTCPAARDLISQPEAPRVVIGEAAAEQTRQAPPLDIAAARHPDSLAYVIYTSGSQGRPKGVAMTHRCLGNLISWQIHQLDASPGARVLLSSPTSFDVSVQEILSTLCSGGNLIVAADDTRKDHDRLARYLAEQEVERVFLTPVGLQQLAEAVLRAGLKPRLTEILAAGERLTMTRPISDMLEQAPGCRLFNQYGPTETHVVTQHMVGQDHEHQSPLPPIGRPISNSRCYILDSGLRQAPIGARGELCIAGASLARGYLDQPRLTAERFLPDPCSTHPGQRLYTTGDLARYRSDGSIEFLGREDDQVKVRGFRVELGEIEWVLSQHELVREAAVTIVGGAPLESRLVAYIVPSSDETPTVDQILRLVRSKLPDFMAPSSLVILEALPLTPSGKVDRARLPMPSHQRPELEQAFVPPRTPVEQTVADICAEVLGLDQVGAHDSFFDLGGHSLLATQLILRINRELDVDLALRQVFEAPTVAEIAMAALEERLEHSDGQQVERLLEELEQQAEEGADEAAPGE